MCIFAGSFIRWFFRPRHGRKNNDFIDHLCLNSKSMFSSDEHLNIWFHETIFASGVCFTLETDKCQGMIRKTDVKKKKRLRKRDIVTGLKSPKSLKHASRWRTKTNVRFNSVRHREACIVRNALTFEHFNLCPLNNYDYLDHVEVKHLQGKG